MHRIINDARISSLQNAIPTDYRRLIDQESHFGRSQCSEGRVIADHFKYRNFLSLNVFLFLTIFASGNFDYTEDQIYIFKIL